MTESKLNWTALAKQAPLNPQSDKNYHPSTLEKVFNGKRKNALLLRWLHGMENQDAKTKERTRNKTRRRANCRSLQNDCREISELSEIAKAIRGEVDSSTTNRSKKKTNQR